MKKFHLLNERTGTENRIEFNIQAMLACLTGTAPVLLMPEFVSLWKQLLPESNFALQLLDDEPSAAASCRESNTTALHNFPAVSEGNIREGPD